MYSIRILTTALLVSLFHGMVFSQKLPKNYGKLETKLFSQKQSADLLLVAFGGSEGGNTFASERTKEVRQRFLDHGYHVLSIGYFGLKGLPKEIDRISLDAIYASIIHTAKELNISNDHIVLLGASRGGELVLNLASNFEFGGVIAMVPSSVTVPSLNHKIPTSSWVLNSKEVDFIDVDEATVNKEGWSKALQIALENQNISSSGTIPVEEIRGFVLLTSGKTDTSWPSYEMCNNMVERLVKSNFKLPYQHLSFDGGHNPSTHFNDVFAFLDEHFHNDSR